MTGKGEVNYEPPAETDPEQIGKATGLVEVDRAAAKILLNIKLPSEIQIKNDAGEVVEEWEPDTGGESNIKVLLNNGVKKSIAAPLPDSEGNPWEPAGSDVSSYYFNSDLGVAETVRYLRHNGSTAPEDKYPYVMNVPFYTYPNAWKEDVSEEYKTTLTLMVPWHKKGTSEHVTYYYQVPATPAGLTHIACNHAYIVNLNVGMLGSLSPDQPLLVENLSYLVVDWEDADISLNINDTRYLVVNPTTYELYNEAEISLPYYSSHPATISDIRIEYERYNFYANGAGDKVTIPISMSQINLSHEGNDSICNYYRINKRVGDGYQPHLTVIHPLTIWNPVDADDEVVPLTGNGPANMVEDTDNAVLDAVLEKIVKYKKPTITEAPYSAYTIYVTLQHADNPAFSETIKIVQYPAMYIEAEKNPGGGVGASGGNVFVNGNSEVDDQNTWQTVSDKFTLGNANSNPNMYVITISQLDAENGSYVIGDPRMEGYTTNLDSPLEVVGTLVSSNKEYDIYNFQALNTNTVDNNTPAEWSEKAISLYYTTNNPERQLTYYYPTVEDVSYRMRVAPRIRVASSYGKNIQSMSRYNARRRVATYQERNYPAGRWRLPTYGEMAYIVKLSQTGKIPALFEKDRCYWTAQGSYKVNEDGTLTEAYNQNIVYKENGYIGYVKASFVRAVYDEWYWDLYESKYQLTPDLTDYQYRLGDMPRSVAPTPSN